MLKFMKIILFFVLTFIPLHSVNAGSFGDLQKVNEGKALKEAANALLGQYIPKLRIYLREVEKEFKEYLSGEIKLEVGDTFKNRGGKKRPVTEGDKTTMGWELSGNIDRDTVSPLLSLKMKFKDFRLYLKNEFQVGSEEQEFKSYFLFKFEF